MTRKKRDLTLASAANNVIKIKRRQSRYEKPIHALWELFADYSETSTIHGIRYLGERKRHWVERLWWFVAFTLSVVACFGFIYQEWQKMSSTPVMVTFADKSTPISDIPFPSVTICTDTKSKQRRFNYTDFYYKLADDKHFKANLTDENRGRFTSVAQMCHKRSYLIDELDGNVTYRNVHADIQRVSPNSREILTKCEWSGKVNCKKMFREILTDEGVCITFNMLNASEIYREENLAKNYSILIHDDSLNSSRIPGESKTYPRRVATGSKGLKVDLRLFTNDSDFLCGGPVQSFKVLLHQAGEIPQMTKYFYRIPLDHDIVMAVRANIMNTTENLLENYEANRRKCFRDGERNLDFFKKYTQRNCQLDCIANRMAEVCKCVKFTMPRKETTPVCGLKKLNCTVDVVADTKCDCLPACESISYDAELSMAKYDRFDYNRVANRKFDHSASHRKYVRLFISFKDDQFFASRRSELYATTDFIANVGGIMGLFMGVSLLSIVEMVYFSTLRLGCNLRRRRRIKKQREKIQRELDSLKIVEDDAKENRVSKISFDENNFANFTENEEEKKLTEGENPFVNHF